MAVMLAVVAVLSVGCTDDVQNLLDTHAPGYEFVAAGPTGAPCARLDLQPSEDSVPIDLGLGVERWLAVSELALTDVDRRDALRATIRSVDGQVVEDVVVADEWQGPYAHDALQEGVALWAGLWDNDGEWWLRSLAQREPGAVDRTITNRCDLQETADQELADLAAALALPSATAIVEAIIAGEVSAEDVRAAG